MERLTNEAIKVDASVDGMIGSFVDLANMKPKLLDVILNGPTLISVSKNVLRSIIRQLYSALAAYEDTWLTPEQCENAKAIIESVFSDDTSKAERIRELLKADRDGQLVVLPCKVGDMVYKIFKERTKCSAYGEFFDESSCCGCECECDSTIQYVIRPIQPTTLSSLALYIEDIGKTVFLTREEAEAALKEANNGNKTDM